MKTIGIIGGSGLERLELFSEREEINVMTPWGETSSSLYSGIFEERQVILLSRHGRSHEIPPHMVNNRANLWALREHGVEGIIATTACGSLRDEIGRGDLVLPDQFIDFTRLRPLSFFDRFKKGELHHVSMGNPFDESLRSVIHAAAVDLGISIHGSGTVITIEGPRFSTRAESRMYRTWGADLVNMSTAPEAILAAELGIPYAVIAMSTDYDAWKEDEDAVTWQDVLQVFRKNTERLTRLLVRVLGTL